MEEEAPRGFRVRDLRGQEKEEKPAVVQAEPARKHHEEVQINFSTFIMSLTTSALIHMGLVEDPHAKKKEKNLPLAKQEVDIIGMLEEKTRGNVTREEVQLLSEALYELRLRFVEVSRK